MALDDIVRRIQSDAKADAERIEAEAAEYAASIVSNATRSAEERRDEDLARAERQAEVEASRVVASARLAARDRALSAKRELIAAALDDVATSLDSLPDDVHVRFLAKQITLSARGDETVRFSEAHMRLREAIAAEVERLAPGMSMTWAEDAELGLAQGLVLEGDRSRTVISPHALIADRRDELELAIAHSLFGEEGE